MNTKVLIPLAVIGLGFAVRTATAERPRPTPEALSAPPRRPFAKLVAGAGILEASTENVSVGSAIAGIVSAVLVETGQDVEAGEALFVLDDRADRAIVLVKRAELAAALSKLEKLRRDPRQESIAPLRAALRENEARLEDAKVQHARWDSLVREAAVSQHEASTKRYAVLVCERQVERAKATLDEALAGTWEPDLAMQEAAVQVARAELARAEVELERLTVRAPVASRILKVNVHPGELCLPSTGAILLGDTDRLHVRVSIDEADVPRFRPGAQARASVKGLAEATIRLVFVRTEPYIVPKRSLTGGQNERVDTRVLEVVFAIDGRSPVPLFVGQQVDAFIEQ